MSVVGTTFGMGEKATRPATEIAASAATSATIWEGGREHHERCELPPHRARSPVGAPRIVSRRTALPCSAVIAAPPRMRATSLEKYQPPESSSPAEPSATT